MQDDTAVAAVGVANPNPNSSTAANVGSPTTFRGGLPAPGDGSILSQGPDSIEKNEEFWLQIPYTSLVI